MDDLPKYPVVYNLQGYYDRIIAIGDVHGCYAQLLELFDSLNKLSLIENSAIIFLGDLVDKGPDSDKVVQFVRNNNFFCVEGNHEERHVRYASHALKGGTNPMKPNEEFLLTHSKLTLKDLEWMSKLPHAICFDDWIFTHAGLGPSGFNMPTKSFIRTRFFEYDEIKKTYVFSRTWKDKDGIWTHSKNAIHWTEIYKGQKWVVYGHEPLLDVKIKDLTFGIDTSAVYGRMLTAMILDCNKDSYQIVQVPGLKENPVILNQTEYKVANEA